MRSAARSALILLSLAAIASCGGGGGGDGGGSSPTPPSGGGGPAAPVIPAVPTGVPVIYLGNSADASTFFPGANIFLEEDNIALLRYVPSTGAVHMVDRRSSPSFAPGALQAITQDNRLFTVNYSTAVARFDLFPVDLVTNAKTKDIFIPSTFTPSCTAIVGDDLIYRDGASWKKFASISTAPLGATPVVIGVANTVGTQCYFNLGSTQGRLLDVQFTNNAGATTDSFIVHERNPATGAAIRILGDFIENVNPGNYESYQFAFDGAFFYLVRKVISTGKIEIWRSSIFSGNPANTPVLRATLTPSALFDGPVGMDVNRGFIAMIGYTGPTPPINNVRLLTYDDNTGVFLDRTLGPGFYGVQVLYLP